MVAPLASHNPPPPEDRRCRLSPSTVARWLDAAGKRARATVDGQVRDAPSAGQLATDGLWARLRGRTKKVMLLLTDGSSGLIWPPVVVDGEEAPAAWQRFFKRAEGAGLILREMRGVTSDGAK